MSVSLTAKCDSCGTDVKDECYCVACSSSGETDVQDDVGDLAAAIRRGDTKEAEYLLDKVAAEMPGWSDRVEIARSRNARAA